MATERSEIMKRIADREEVWGRALSGDAEALIELGRRYLGQQDNPQEGAEHGRKH
ncbi:MAG: hypothetical protein LUF34_09220 [Lachnospiraceae bacterium]|nr:hypothetical protein [Lachnospiraceae bacterium]